MGFQGTLFKSLKYILNSMSAKSVPLDATEFYTMTLALRRYIESEFTSKEGLACTITDLTWWHHCCCLILWLLQTSLNVLQSNCSVLQLIYICAFKLILYLKHSFNILRATLHGLGPQNDSLMITKYGPVLKLNDVLTMT